MKNTEPPATPKTPAQVQKTAVRGEADLGLTLPGELTRGGNEESGSNAGLSDMDRLVRVAYLALTGDKWEPWSQGLPDGVMAEHVASTIMAAGFGDVAAMKAKRDAALAVIADALAQTKRGNVLTPPWVIEALSAKVNK